MIVTITSCAPNRALSTPGTAPTRPPPSAAASRYTGRQSSAGIPPPQPPPSRPREQKQGKAEQRGTPRRQQQSRQRGDEPARSELALGADVEQARAQAEPHGEAGEGQRGGLVQHLPESVRVP